MRWLLVVPFLLLVLLLSPAHGVVMVELRPVATVSGEYFYLDELAQVTGWPGDRVVVGRAPLAGYQRRVTPMMVRGALLRAGLAHDEEIIVRGERVTVSLATQTVLGTQLLNAAEQALRSVLSDYQRVEVEANTVPNDLELPCGTVTFQADVAGSSPYIGRVTVRVVVLVDGTEHTKKTTRWEVVPYQEVLVATVRITPGTELTVAQFELAEKPLTRNTAMAIRDISSIAGMWADRMIYPGTVLTARSFKPIPTVGRNSQVTIIARRAGIVMTALGETREAGFIGDIIRVTNVDSGRLLRAEIVNENTVIVR